MGQREGLGSGAGIGGIQSGGSLQNLPQAPRRVQGHVARHTDSLGKRAQGDCRSSRGWTGSAADQLGECRAQGCGEAPSRAIGAITIQKRSPMAHHSGQGNQGGIGGFKLAGFRIGLSRRHDRPWTSVDALSQRMLLR